MSIGIEEVLGQNAVINSTKLEPVEVTGHNPVMLHHREMQIADLEKYAEKPYRARASETFNTAKAIGQYIKDFKTDATRVFADLRNQALNAVFDYHTPKGEPGWREHNAKLVLTLDPDYANLKDELHGEWMSQREFVSSLTDLASFITGYAQKPGDVDTVMAKADFLEIVRDLKGQTEASVEGKVGTSSVSGSSSYTSSVTSARGELPDTMTMRLPVYMGEAAVDHKFRVESKMDGGLVMRLVLIRPEKVREEAFKAIVAVVAAEGETSIYGL